MKVYGIYWKENSGNCKFMDCFGFYKSLKKIKKRLRSLCKNQVRKDGMSAIYNIDMDKGWGYSETYSIKVVKVK